MKKSLLALAALSVVAGGAYAQSSVTIGGRLDLSLRSVDNGTNTLKTLSSSGGASQQINIRGIEDLGGGLKASFWLESGLNLDIGAAGGSNRFGDSTAGGNGAALFNRQAWVALGGGFGEVRLGRDYVPTFWNLTRFDPFGTQGVGAYTNIFPGGGIGLLLADATRPGTGSDLVRANNTVGYFLPAVGGLYGQLQVAAGEGTPTTGTAATTTVTQPTPGRPANKYIGGRLGYAAGPVNVAVAYGIRYDVLIQSAATKLTEDRLKSGNIAGSFDFGVLKLIGQFGKIDQGDRDLKTYQLATTIPVGAGLIKASYSKLKDNLNDTSDAKQIALGYVYNLSKRTSLYATASKLSNDASGRYSVSPAGNNESGTPLAGKDVKGYEFGIGHNF
jgi:predicted porin